MPRTSLSNYFPLFLLLFALVSCQQSTNNQPSRLSSSPSTQNQNQSSYQTEANVNDTSQKEAKTKSNYPDYGTASVITLRANLREQPNSSSTVVTEVEERDELTLIKSARLGAWYQVLHWKTGKTGWIHGNAIEIINQKNGSTDETAKTNETSSSDNNSSASTTSTQEKLIIGNRKSGIYHWQGCPNYNDIASYNREYFSTREEAEAAGYRAARNCGGSSSSTPVYTPQKRQSSPSTSAPNGATALCRDGTYSYSANRRGTCSHHGGVAVWY